MKKFLKVAALVFLLLIAIAILYDILSGRYAYRQQSFNNELKYNSSLSYVFDSRGRVKTERSSPLIDWTINDSKYPLRGRAPLSFTLDWKIDPSIKLDSCQIYGPGLRWDWWGFGHEFLKSHQGSLAFKEVMAVDLDDPNYLSAPIYNGVAVFKFGLNRISIDCLAYDEQDGPFSRHAVVSVWFDK